MQDSKNSEYITYDKITVSVLLLLFSPPLSHAFTWSADKIGDINVLKYLFLSVNVFVGIFFHTKDTFKMIMIGINILSTIGIVLLLGYYEILIVNSIF